MFTFAIILVGILSLTASSIAGQSCIPGRLQRRVSFRRLSGTWNQAYYAGPAYQALSCVEHTIYDVDAVAREFKMDSTIVTTYDGASHTATSTANWGKGNTEGGVPTVDVDIKAGLRSLPTRKIREVAEILDNVGVDFFGLSRRQQIGCDE